MFSNFGNARGKRIAYVVLACLIPAALLIAIFNFIQYEQTNATKNVPVAVVNQDKSIESNGQVINMGEQVVSTLKKDKQVKWEFMDEATAQKKLKSGDVYLEIKLPKDFSANAGTAMEKNPKVSLVDVYKSKKNNYVSSMVSTTVAETVTNQVKTDLQEAYSKTLLNGVKKLSDGTKQAADGTQQLDDGMIKLKDGNSEIVRNLDLLSTKMIEFKSGAKTLDEGVNTYTTGVDTLASANTKMLAGIQELAAKAQPLVSGTAQLADGSSQLKTGIVQLQSGVPGSTDPDEVGIDSAFSQIQAGIAANDGIISNVSSMTATMKQAQTDTAKLKTDMAGMQSALATMKTLAPLLGTLEDAKKDITGLQNKLKLVMLFYKSSEQVSKDTTASTNAQAALDAEIAKVTDPTQKAALEAASKTNASATTTLASDAKINAGLLEKVNTDSTEALNKFSAQLSESTLSEDDANQMITQVEGIMTEANSLFAETDGLLSDDSINQLKTVAGSTTVLKSNLTHVQGVIDTALGKLISGATQVADGNGSLAKSAPTLIDGVGQLLSGITQLNAGSSQLTTASPQLRAGTSQIVDATDQAASGSKQLADGSQQVQDGLVTAANGTNTLNTSLQDGVAQLTPVNDTNKNTDHFATPVVTKNISNDTQDLKNTFAPLVLALVLFLSAVVTQLGLFIPKKRKVSLLQEPLLSIGITAVVQAIVASILIGVLGVTVANWLGLILFTLLTSIFFTLICMLLYHVFGRVGVLFAVLLALLQVIITGQVFPNAMLSGFYQAVGNVLPMTYAIHGFENLINGGDYNVWLAIAMLTIFTAILGGIAYLVDMLLNRRESNDTPDSNE